MKDSLFFHPLMKPIKYQHKSFLQITGLNLKNHFFIQQVIEWSVLGHRYTERQVEDLNQEEVKWICKEKQIGKSNYEYLSITNREDLLFHLSPRKGSIVSYYLNLIQNQIEISEYITQINTLLDKISSIYNHMNQNQGIKLNYQSRTLQIRDVNTSYLDAYISFNQLHSLEFMSNEGLFNELLKILEIILQQSEKTYLLRLENLSTLLDDIQINIVLSRVYDLCSTYQIEVINFAKNEHELFVNEDVVESIVICGDNVEQLVDYTSLEGYIQTNYPKFYQGNQTELILKIKGVSPYLCSKKGSSFVKDPIDQVFFVLMNLGIGFHDYLPLEIKTINKLEWNFLEDNLYKSS